MKINKTLLTILLFAVAFTTTACNETKKVDEPIEIHLQVPSTSDNLLSNTLYMNAVENFHKINPQIAVTIDYAPDIVPGETSSNLDIIKLLENDNSPDIVRLSTSNVSLIEKKNLVMDLLPLLQSGGSKEIDISQNILDLATINNKLLAIPFMVSPAAVRFNKVIFDAAHIPFPQGDWTWEQFRAISKKLKPSGGSVLTYDYSTLDMLMTGTGTSLLSPGGDTAVGYLDSQAAIQTIQWLNAYYHDDTAKKAPMGLNELMNFSQLQTGMIILHSGDRIWKDQDIDKIGIAPLPHFEGSKRANPLPFFGFAISQKSKHPQEALKFIEYLTSTNNEDSVKFAAGSLATSKAIAEALGQSSDPINSVYADETRYAVKPSSDYSPFYNKAWNNAELTAQFQKLLFTIDKDIPDKLHDLALKFDQEMNRLKNAEDQTTTESLSQ